MQRAYVLLDRSEKMRTGQDEMEETAQVTSNSILKKLSLRNEDHLQLYVEVEVEELTELNEVIEVIDDETETTDSNITFDSVVCLRESSDDVAQEQYMDEDLVDKKPQPSKYNFKRATVLEELDKFTDKTNKVDVLIDIHIRNYFGRYFFKHNSDIKEAKFQVLFNKWKLWCSKKLCVRGAPLSYKCYICNKCWWHYNEFREHLDCHENFKLHLEVFGQECIIYAYMNEVFTINVNIDENCWRCGNTSKFHENKIKYNKSYDCSGCSRKFSTCAGLSYHVGACDYERSLEIPGTSREQVYPCEICQVKCFSQKDLDDHLNGRHSVRSDLPIFTNYSDCKHCSMRCDELTHECKTLPYTEHCEFCDRKFHKPINCQIHTKLNEKDYKCPICGVVLPRKCMELKHLLKHTNKYKILYKCLLCPRPVYFTKLELENHNSTSHQHSNSKYYFDEVVIPEALISKINTKPRIRRKEKLKPIKELKQKMGDIECHDAQPPSKQTSLAGKEIFIAVASTSDVSQNGLQENGVINNKIIRKETANNEKRLQPGNKRPRFNILRKTNKCITSKDSTLEPKEIALQNRNNLVLLTKEGDKNDITSDAFTKNHNELDIRHEKSNFVNEDTDNTQIVDKDLQKDTSIIKSPILAENTFICDICTFKTNIERLLISHLNVHKSVKKYCCSHCDYITTEKTNLISHIRTHTGEKPFSCDICQKNFIEKGSLNSHIRTHTGEKPFSCHVCQNKFALQGNLIRHIKSHTGERPFSCDFCEKKFTLKCNLKRHTKKHIEEGLFSCDYCVKKFAVKHQLNKHMRTHPEVKPFSCNVCEKKFAEKGRLNNHIRLHSGERPFSCEICKKKFKQRNHLHRHTRLHTGETPFHCDVCKNKFSSRQFLISHIRTHSRESTVSCDVCNKKFLQKTYLKRHMRTHT